MLNPNSNPELERLTALYHEVRTLLRSRQSSPEQIMWHISQKAPGYVVPPSLGGSLTDADVLQAMNNINARTTELEEEKTPVRDMAGNIAMSALHGASFGSLDEIIGLFSEENQRAYREQLGDFRDEHGVISAVSEGAGGFLVPGLASIGALRRGKTALRAAGAGSLVGGVEGGVAGLAEAEGSLTERLPEAAIGAGVGTALGGLIGGGTHGARYLRKFLTGSEGRSVEEAAREFAQSGAASSRGIPGILEDFERRLQIDPDTRLADLPEMRQVTSDAARMSQEGRDVITQALPTRAQNASVRVGDMLAESMDIDLPADLTARTQRLIDMRKAGNEAYAALEQTVSMPVERMASLLRSEPVHDAWRSANRKNKLFGGVTDYVQRSADGRVKRDAGGLMLKEGTELSFRDLQAIKGTLDFNVTNFARRGDPDIMKRWQETRDAFSTLMREEISAFGPAQRQWYELKEMERAVSAGGDFLNRTPNEIAEEIRQFGRAGEGFANAYREAAAEQVAYQLRNRTRSQDVTKWFDKENMQRRLENLFPEGGDLQGFREGLEREHDKFKLFRATSLGDAPPSRDLAQHLMGGIGSPDYQRAGAAGVAPLLQGGRLAADLRFDAVSKGARKRAEKVGGLLTRSTLGEPGGLDATNLLTGSTGSIKPGLLSELAFRSPAAMLLALRGN